MALSDDPVNRARGQMDYVTDENGNHTEILIEITIEGAQWETIKGSSIEAADFVSWLADNVAE